MTIVTQDELLRLADLKEGQRAALRRKLKEARIPFKELNGNIFTTEEAITATLVGRAKEKSGPDLDAIAPARAPEARRVPLRSRS